MAIIKIGVIFILLLAFSMLCVSATDIGTGTFTVDGADGKNFDVGASLSGNHYGVTDIMFNDASAVEYASSITCRYNSSYWGLGNTSENAWWDVTYKVGATTVGTGIFGWNKAGDGNHYITAFFNTDFSLSGYSGVTYVTIDGIQVVAGNEEIETYYYGNLPADADAVGFRWHSATVMPGNYQYNYIYSTSNDYVYGQDNSKNYLDVSRTAETSSQYLITTVEREIVNETSPGTSDDSFYDTNFTNTQWTVYFSDPADHTETYYLNFDAPVASLIEWGADSYVIDDTGSYSWTLTNDDWDTFFYSKKASIYRDETMVDEVSLPSQTDTFYYTFEDEGSFTVKLRHTSALLPHKTLDTDTVSVTPIGESFIGVTNATVYINSPIGFQFSYGFTPLPVSPGVWSSATSIEARKLIDGNWIPVNQWFFPPSILENITANTLYDITVATSDYYPESPLVSEGEYMFYLTDFNHGDVASTNIYTVEYQPGIPPEDITTTYLNIVSGETYLYDDLFTFKYGIDNTNFTNGINYIEIYNYDHEIITQSALLFKQSWYKDGYIFPETDEDPIEQFQYGIIVALPGNNTMRIRHDDINGSTELVHDNFTLSENNVRGYGLKLSAYEACINEAVIIWVTIPSAANLTIYSPYGTEIITYNLNASTTITYYFPVSGQYDLKLVPSGLNYAERTATIYISDCADDGIITPPSGEMDDMYINMFNFMTLPIFWGMIIFVGFIGGLSMKTNRNGDHLVSGNGLAFIAFGLLNLLAFIGMLAPYTMYAIVSTWIFAGIFFGVGRYLARGE